MRRFQRYYPCRWKLLLATLVAGLALLGGCDTSVDLPEKPARAFTMWGALTPRLDTQTVKVFPMGTVLQELPRTSLGATVTSTDLTAGGARVWRDSALREPDGELVHVFWAPFTPKYGHTYRIEARSPRQGTASAQVTIPELIDLEVLPTLKLGGDPRARVRVPPGPPEVLPEATLRYWVQFGNVQPNQRDPIRNKDVTRTIRLRAPVRRRENGWLVSIRLREDALKIESRVAGLRAALGMSSGSGRCCHLDLIRLEAEVRIVDEAWSFPGDSISVKVMTQPGALSNVENGLGLIGAGYTQRVEIPVGNEIADAAGFRADF